MGLEKQHESMEVKLISNITVTIKRFALLRVALASSVAPLGGSLTTNKTVITCEDGSSVLCWLNKNNRPSCMSLAFMAIRGRLAAG